jgi:aspartokinase
VVQNILNALENGQIHIHTTLQSAMSTTVIVPHAMREKAIKQLHALI